MRHTSRLRYTGKQAGRQAGVPLKLEAAECADGSLGQQVAYNSRRSKKTLGGLPLQAQSARGGRRGPRCCSSSAHQAPISKAHARAACLR